MHLQVELEGKFGLADANGERKGSSPKVLAPKPAQDHVDVPITPEENCWRTAPYDQNIMNVILGQAAFVADDIEMPSNIANCRKRVHTFAASQTLISLGLDEPLPDQDTIDDM